MQKKVTFANGDVYEGETESFGERVDLPHGRGKMTYANGNVYEGETHHGKPHGKGKRAWPDGFVKEGEWKNGEFTGNEQITGNK